MNSSTYSLSFEIEIKRIQVGNEPIKFELIVITNNAIGGVWKTNVPSSQIEQVTALARLQMEQQYKKYLNGDIEFYDNDNYDIE
ncbi:MAG: hypothetical protein RSD51_03370 [Malacoplasma sp.]